jgi:uncharacterized cysteine cluster protein YcgN (CxxCxxCC family)
MKNLCGNCDICCIIFRIDKKFLFWKDTDKEAGEVCDKLRKNRCSTYLKRPKPCKDYKCFWLQILKQKVKEPEWRPDKIGFVVSTEENDGTYILTVIELKKDSLNFNKLTKEQDNFLKYIFNLSGKINKNLSVMIQPFGHNKKYPLRFTP